LEFGKSKTMRFVLRIGAIGFALMASGSAVAADPLSLGSLGLSGLRPVSDRAGLQVRGMSSRAYSMSVASLSALIYDPATGSQTNVDIAHFSNSESQAFGGNSATAATEGVVGFTGLDIAIGGFRATISPGALFVGGQSAGGGAFAVGNLNVPRFR